jgi:hypothetical protein
MLLPEDVHPHNSLYLNGAYILQALINLRELSMMDLYVESHKLHEIPMPIFVLSLDWLFLADLVSYNARGNFEPCF